MSDRVKISGAVEIDDLRIGSNQPHIDIINTSGSYTTSTSPTTIVFDTVRSSSSDFTLSSGIIESTGADGKFVFLSRISLELTGGNSRTSSRSWIESSVNGGTSWSEIAGTSAYGYHRNQNQGQNTASIQAIVDVESGNKFRIRFRREFGNASLINVQNGSTLSIFYFGGR